MEDNKRELWGSLIADLEEQHETPIANEEDMVSSENNSLSFLASGTTLVPGISGKTSSGNGMQMDISGAPPVASSVLQNSPSMFVIGQSNGVHFNHGFAGSPNSHKHKRQRNPNKPITPWMMKKPPLTTTETEIPHTLALREWMKRKPRIKQPVQVSNTLSWRGSNSQSNAYDKRYLEEAVQIAYSIATNLRQRQQHVNSISIDNVVILNTQNGTCDFIEVAAVDEQYQRNEIAEIRALGRLFYELFTQGAPPPPVFAVCNPLFNIGSALNISDGEGRKSVAEEQHRPSWPQRRRREDGSSTQSISTSLASKGLPISIRRLVSDMQPDPSGVSSDSAVSSLNDVVCDLQQMRQMPKSFLHESLLTRWKPLIKDKLYCRDVELRKALDVANRVGKLGNELEEELDDVNVAKDHEVLMVSGHSGSGKTHFVRELSIILERKGWKCLHCKFDRVNPRPLLFIISAFDRYFALLTRDCIDDNSNRELAEVRRRILDSFADENMSILCQLIPNVRRIVSEEEMPLDTYIGTFDRSDMDTEASTCRLHHLFGLLVKAIAQRPLLIFLDDLHWADQASLDLLLALIHQQVSDGLSVFFVGSFRLNEVSNSDPLDICLKQIHALTSVSLTQIVLSGLSCDEVNIIVSEALSYPQRLSRPLSTLIHEKSTGNILFVKEFLNDMATENLLNYSLSSQKWEWEEELIVAREVSDGVAELLSRRLLRLSESERTAIKVMSVFGSQVPLKVLSLIRDVCGISDIIFELVNGPAKEGLIKRTEDEETCFVFIHDMIQSTVQNTLIRTPDERTNMLKEISETILARTSEDRSDDILFTLMEFINRVGPEGATREDCLRYANLNLCAGEKAIQTPDYGSACVYLESGISFLGEEPWSGEYGLVLHLFKKAAYVHHAKGDTELMMTRLNEVFDNAICFDDKLDSLNVLIQAMSLDANNLSNAFEKSCWVLEQLGESFPCNTDHEAIASDLLQVKYLLERHKPGPDGALSNLPPMVNPQKIKAMNFFPTLLLICYQMKSPFLPCVASRMTRITLEYGVHETSSAFGLCMYALVYLTVFQDISEGYRLGKYALALATKNPNPMPDVYCVIYGMINIYKEPLQAILPQLMTAHKEGMNAQSGNFSFTLINSSLYTYRAFFSGSKLLALYKEVTYFIRLYSLYKRHTLGIAAKVFSNAITVLVGQKRLGQNNTFGDKDNDEILAKSLETKGLNVSETVVVSRVMCNFIFRALDEAKEVAEQYFELLRQHDSGSMQFISIYRYFYGGLIAFDSLRKAQDGSKSSEYWTTIAEHSVLKFETWATESEWNFQNKFLLLQAEQHFTERREDKARSLYNLAISSAKDHRFIHEEAIACELAGYFHLSIGEVDESSQLLKRAVECYTTWGAYQKANILSTQY